MAGPVGVQISEIAALCDLYGIHDQEERIDFLMIMKMLDDHNIKSMPRKKDG